MARGAHCSDRHQRLHRAPCAASTLAVHSSARHALQLRAASRCSVACALPETAQGCGSVRSTLLERCRWPAVHVVRWGFVGGCFQRTARAVNYYFFRSSVHPLAPCTRRRAGCTQAPPVRGARARRARGSFFKKPGSRPAPYNIFFTFINISTVNFELGNGLPREFWA